MSRTFLCLVTGRNLIIALPKKLFFGCLWNATGLMTRCARLEKLMKCDEFDGREARAFLRIYCGATYKICVAVNYESWSLI